MDTRFVVITTKTGSDIKLTDDHFKEWSNFGKIHDWDTKYGFATIEISINDPIPQILLGVTGLSVCEDFPIVLK